jgi:hypothetical protein
MSTLSPNFGLTLPDGPDPISRSSINGNWTLVDTLARAIICTSATRPSSPFAGQVIFETDTLSILIRNVANSAWTLVSPRVQSVTQATRPGSPAASQVIYESDTNALVVRNSANTVWNYVSGIPIVNGTVGVNTTTNMIVYDTTLPGLRRYTGGAWEIWHSNAIHKYKAATESVTSSTTLQNDDVFAFSVVANAAYEMEGCIFYDGAQDPAGGLSMAFTIPVSASALWCNFGTNGDIISTSLTEYNAVSQGTNARTVGTQITATATMACQPKGTFVIGANSGTVQFQWAQGASNATATRILGGSWMKLTRMA